MIEVACLNANVLRTHGQTGQRKTPSYLHFRLELLHELIGGYHGRSCRGRPSLTPYEPRLDQLVSSALAYIW